MKIKRLIQTAFPRFKKKELEQVKGVAPSLDDGNCDTCSESGSSHSGDEAKGDFVAQFNKREAQYHNKEDQDVAMFLSLVDRMSVKSLVFILQGHARSMHSIENFHLEQTLELIEYEKDELMEEEEEEETESNDVVVLTSSMKRIKGQPKHCRFAEIMGGQKIREVVVEIPHHKDYTPEEKADTWWSSAEMGTMRKEAAKVVQFFYNHRPEYAESVTLLAESHRPDADDILVEHHVKKLAENSFPRGLEGHIVDSLTESREEAVQAVLLQQEMYQSKMNRLSGSSFFGRNSSSSKQSDATTEQKQQELVDEFWEKTRERYIAKGETNKALALKLAECDHIEALKAMLSRWIPQVPPSAFFNKRK